MDKISNLVSEIFDAKDAERIEQIRDEINNLVFSYRNGSVHRKLCRWNSQLDLFIAVLYSPSDMMQINSEINEIINVVHQLELGNI